MGDEDMSINCIGCIKNRRTGIDLLCDECREKERGIKMLEIWREFILRYNLRLPFVSLETILKAFYYFEGNTDEADKTMGVNP